MLTYADVHDSAGGDSPRSFAAIHRPGCGRVCVRGGAAGICIARLRYMR
jgi:hypothetical protein